MAPFCSTAQSLLQLGNGGDLVCMTSLCWSGPLFPATFSLLAQLGLWRWGGWSLLPLRSPRRPTPHRLPLWPSRSTAPCWGPNLLTLRGRWAFALPILPLPWPARSHHPSLTKSLSAPRASCPRPHLTHPCLGSPRWSPTPFQVRP